jgi:hypothetical protein
MERSPADVRAETIDTGLARARLARILRDAAPPRGRVAVYTGGASAPRLVAEAGSAPIPLARAAAAAALERGETVKRSAIAEDGTPVSILALPIGERCRAALVLSRAEHLGPGEEHLAFALARLVRTALRRG